MAEEESIPVRELVNLAAQEGKRRVVGLATIFAVVSVSVLTVGLTAPKRYEASTLIVADSRDIIKPLLEGRAVPTTISDQTPIVVQEMGSARVLREVLAFGGWARKSMSPADEDRMLKALKGRIKVEAQKDDTIKISYYDNTPQRTYRVTNKLAEIFIRQSLQLKERQSREAFDFISRRVNEYASKLSEAHEKLLAYYRGEGSRLAPRSAPAPEPSADAPASHPRTKISTEELDALRAEEATLMAQLAKKRPAAAAADHQAEQQARQKVSQLQTDLDRLRATYTDEHPDVRRVTRELETAKKELARVEDLGAERTKAEASAEALDNDVARAAAARLEVVQQKLTAATGVRRRAPTPTNRLAALNPATASGTDLEMRAVGQDTGLSELLRRYEATRDVYQDLLKRQENARVSMDLDSEHRGLTLRVQEAAEVPVISSSVRLLYVALGALALGTLVPLGLLIAIVMLDARVRIPGQIEVLARVPLLVAIPAGGTSSSGVSAKQQTRFILAATIVVAVFLFFVVSLLLNRQA
jgi:polysaccharide chain length determinant protein (PEP-CTERM system associated)